MLVIKVQVGEEKIEELWIQRVESLEKGRQLYGYIVTRPAQYKNIKVIHRRDDGWKILLMKVLNAINTSELAKRAVGRGYGHSMEDRET